MKNQQFEGQQERKRKPFLPTDHRGRYGNRSELIGIPPRTHGTYIIEQKGTAGLQGAGMITGLRESLP